MKWFRNNEVFNYFFFNLLLFWGVGVFFVMSDFSILIRVDMIDFLLMLSVFCS